MPILKKRKRNADQRGLVPEKETLSAERLAPVGEPTPEASGTQPLRRPEKSTKQLIVGFFVEMIAIAASVWLLLSFVICVTIHYGNNMFPSIKDGDLVITYRLDKPFLNAAVLYEHEGTLRLGRVVGMPGNEIDISPEGALKVNGIAPAEEVFYPTMPAEGSDISYPCTVGEGQVFILNDFRTDTSDSRSFGSVDLKDLRGVMLLTMRRRGF